MAITLQINGVDKTSILRTTNPSFTLPVKGQRGSSSFRLKNEPTDSAYTPSEGQKVEWFDGATRVWLGTIDTIKTTAMIPTGGGYFYDITAVSFEQRIDKRTITRTFAGGVTAGSIVSSILGNELSAEGIVAGTITSGATLHNAQVYDHARISDVFTSLAALAQTDPLVPAFVWYVNPADGALYFTPASTTAAPFSVVDADVLAGNSPSATISRTNYRNRQHVKINTANLLPNREQFAGDGSTSSFTLSKSIASIVSVSITTAVASTATGTFTGNPSPGDYITIGDHAYVFVADTSGNFNTGDMSLGFFFSATIYVLIGANATETAQNLVDAVNGTGSSGTTSSPALNIVCDGDSLTHGYPSSFGSSSYPGQCGSALGVTVTNLGVDGALSQDVIDTHIASADALFDATKQNFYVLWIGFNDIAGAGTLATLKANVASIVSGRQAVGFKVIVLTLTPSNYALQAATFPADRTAYNAWLLAGSSGADVVCDSGDSATLSDTTNTTYFQADQVHLTTAGYSVIAQSVVAKLQPLFGSSGNTYSSYASKNLVVSISASGTTITATGLPGENSNGLNLQSACSVFSWDGAAAGGAGGGVTSQSFAESSNISSGASYQWEYTTGGTTITQTAGQTPLASGETLFVEYQPVGFGVVTVDNPAEIATRQAAEGGSGIYENIAIRTDLLTIDDGVAAAQTLLANNDSMVDTVQFDTDQTGLMPGQYASIVDSALDVNGNFTIQSVTGRAIKLAGVDQFRYSITAVSSTQPQTGVAMFAALANTGALTGLAGTGASSASGASKITPIAMDPSNTDLGFALNFGVDDDTVGTNVTGKYAPITADGVPFEGYVTVKTLGTFPAVDTIFDVLFSSDYGATWTSIFPLGVTPLGGGIVIPGEAIAGSQDTNFAANPRIRLITSFAGQSLKKGWLTRLDCLQGGGALDIEIWIHGQPSGKSGQQLNFTGPGITSVPLVF